MKINIRLEDKLVEQALALTGVETKQELINLASVKLVELRSPKNLLDLAGQFVKDIDINYILQEIESVWRNTSLKKVSSQGQIVERQSVFVS